MKAWKYLCLGILLAGCEPRNVFQASTILEVWCVNDKQLCIEMIYKPNPYYVATKVMSYDGKSFRLRSSIYCTLEDCEDKP